MPTSGRICSCCSAGRRRRDGSSAADGNDYGEEKRSTKKRTIDAPRPRGVEGGHDEMLGIQAGGTTIVVAGGANARTVVA